MGLFGPKKSSRQPATANGFAKTGGAGNMSWYNSQVEAAAAATSSRRPSSASRGPSQMQYGPASATRRPNEQFAPTQMRPLSARTLAAIPTAYDHEEDCICTVCSCGKHACPPTPRTTHYDPNMTTEARDAYAGRFVPAVRAGAPGRYKPNDAPFEGTSTNHADYTNPGPSVPRRSPPRSSMMDTGVGRNNVPFDDTTTHKSDFPSHPLQPRKSGGPHGDNLSTLGPDSRDFTTTGRNDYPAHPTQARRSRAPEEARPSMPFHGESTSKQDFPHHVGARPSIPKFRSGGFQPNPEDRDFGTENRGCYTPKRLETCPAIPVAVASKSHPGHVHVEYVPGTTTYCRKQMW